MPEKPTTGQLIKQLEDELTKQANNSLRQSGSGLTMVQMWVLLHLNEP